MAQDLTLQEMQEQAEQRAVELASIHKVAKVHAKVIQLSDGTFSTAYFKEPNRATKMYAFDQAVQSITMAGDTLINTCLIKEESDPRILVEGPENDKIYMSFNIFAQSLVQVYNAAFEKKN